MSGGDGVLLCLLNATGTDTVIYELHVKGITATHPRVPARSAARTRDLGHEAALAHLVGLGVTAVELLPVHHSVPEAFLLQRGLTNYWGYNTIDEPAASARTAGGLGNSCVRGRLRSSSRTTWCVSLASRSEIHLICHPHMRGTDWHSV